MPTRDTQTLAVEARLIVEGVLGDAREEKVRDLGTALVREFRVDNVLHGPTATVRWRDGAAPGGPATRPADVKAGDTISVVGVYGTIDGGLTPDGRSRPVGAGDRMILFLAHRDERIGGASAILGETSAQWAAPPHAYRYIHDGKAYAFMQCVPANDRRQIIMSTVTVTVTPDTVRGVAMLTADEFRGRIRQVLDDAPMNDELLAKATRDDVPRLLSFIAATSRTLAGEVSPSGHWRTWSSVKVDQLADAETIVEAFERPDESPGYRPDSALDRRADCRELLLDRLERGLVPKARQVVAADRLAGGGGHYAHALRDSTAGVGSPPPHGGRYLRRVIDLSIATPDDDVAAKLFDVLDDAKPSEAKFDFPRLDAELKESVDTLAAAWPKLASPRRRYEAMAALRVVAPEVAARTAPGAGPFLSLLKEREPNERIAVDAMRRVRLRFDWRNFLAKDDPSVALSLVFRAVDSGREFERAITSKATGYRQQGRRGQFGGDYLHDIELPAGVERGRYEAFLRARQGDQAIGDGFGPTIDVP